MRSRLGDVAVSLSFVVADPPRVRCGGSGGLIVVAQVVAPAARTLLGGLNAVDLWYRYAEEQSPIGIDDADALASVISDLLVRGFRQA
jgi:hypothetical protein